MCWSVPCSTQNSQKPEPMPADLPPICRRQIGGEARSAGRLKLRQKRSSESDTAKTHDYQLPILQVQ